MNLRKVCLFGLVLLMLPLLGCETIKAIPQDVSAAGSALESLLKNDTAAVSALTSEQRELAQLSEEGWEQVETYAQGNLGRHGERQRFKTFTGQDGREIQIHVYRGVQQSEDGQMCRVVRLDVQRDAQVLRGEQVTMCRASDEEVWQRE